MIKPQQTEFTEVKSEVFKRLTIGEWYWYINVSVFTTFQE